ncbi:MAG: carboxypeptidase regulatory-like domain-containing protein [Micropepsaceae bacterium]
MTQLLRVALFLLPLTTATITASAYAAAFKGKVALPDGKPAYGAMVTVTDATREQRQTVYTASDGSYVIRTSYAGGLTIRARLAGYEDFTVTQTVPAEGVAQLDLSLRQFASLDEASNALSASAFNARLPWKDLKQDRPAFISQCNYCHQVGNATTRMPMSHQEWMTEINKMEGLLAMVSQRQKATIADVLSRGFDAKPIQAVQSYGASPELARGKVTEWLVGDGYTFIHDADVAGDQKLYGTDEGHDILWILDRTTGKIEQHKLPDIDLPRGGLFSGMQLPIGVFSGKHGPHSMAQTKDGRIWITNALSSTLMSFDPVTKVFKTYQVGHDALYPHTVRVDQNDIVWFTIVASNQIGRFDPKTEEMTVLRLPSNGFIRWTTDMLFPTLMRIGSWFPDQAVHLNLSTHKVFGYSILAFPYGIDVNPVDGSIWYAKLYASRIGRIDSTTFEITEWDTPMKGPRRPRFDAKGILWIPAFDEGGLMRFDPSTKAFETYVIPSVGKGEYETPYALNVERTSGDIWLAANNSDRILRFKPATKTFFSYPSPTRVTVLRDFSFAKDGSVCSSSSNLPAYAIEDARPSFICVDPEGGARDREDLAHQADQSRPRANRPTRSQRGGRRRSR